MEKTRKKMQMQMPIFPSSTKLLSATRGVFQKDDSVYYLHNGSPVYTHHKDDINTYRLTATLIVNNSCSATQLSAVFGVSTRNFQRYAKRLRTGGSDAFFNPIDNRGRCHKMTPDKLTVAQKYLDLGYSQQKTGKAINVNEATIRYHLRKGSLKKKDNSAVTDQVQLTNISERNAADVAAGESLGIAATRVKERMDACKGVLKQTPIEFIASEGVEYGGVLFLLPSLLATGLLSYQKHYTSLSGYYDLDSIILSLALMYLCRIKNPEQLKHTSPGEFSKLLGLDRIPDAKNLRQKISQILTQQQARQWNRDLARSWVAREETYFYYVDGHVKVYSGYNLNYSQTLAES